MLDKARRTECAAGRRTGGARRPLQRRESIRLALAGLSEIVEHLGGGSDKKLLIDLLLQNDSTGDLDGQERSEGVVVPMDGGPRDGKSCAANK